MTIDSPKSIVNPACAEKISIFSAHAGCALPGASGSLRASSLSGQDFKPTIQAGGLAAYSLLGVPPSAPRLKLVAESRFIKVLDKYWKLDYTNLVNEKYYQLFQRKKMKSDAIDNDERRRAQCYPQSRR